MTVEEWLPIPGFEGRYDVSDLGQVRSWLGWHGQPVPRILKPSPNTDGYLHVSLCLTGRAFTRTVHGLVALAFVGPCPEGMEVRHLDGDHRGNNRLTNLVYGTSSENTLDAVAHGTWTNNGNIAKTHCPAGHPYDDANTYNHPRGGRECRVCRDRARKRHAAKRPV